MRGWMEYTRAAIERRRPTEAGASFQQSLVECSAAGYVYGILEANEAIAKCSLVLGDVERARVLLHDLHAQLPRDRHFCLVLGVQLGFAGIEQVQGNWAEAERRYASVAKQSGLQDELIVESQAHVGRGACLWGLGRQEEALEAWSIGLQVAERTSPLRILVTRAAIDLCREDAKTLPR
jgi:hypothetical protein